VQRKTWNRIIPAVAGLAATVVAALPASAHEGHHEQMPMMQALRHLVSEPDHQIAFAALVVLAVIAGWSWRRAKARK
jgi:hydrogenase/urease accessory protein HupE